MFRFIVFNPLKERALERFADPQSPVEMATFSSTPIASTYYQVKVGGDVAALKGIMKALLAMDAANGQALDHDFIRDPHQWFRGPCRRPGIDLLDGDRAHQRSCSRRS